MQLRKLRPSPSLVVASMALAVATGGTSYAAMTVGSADIRDDSVRSKDVRTGPSSPGTSAPSRGPRPRPAGRW